MGERAGAPYESDWARLRLGSRRRTWAERVGAKEKGRERPLVPQHRICHVLCVANCDMCDRCDDSLQLQGGAW